MRHQVLTEILMASMSSLEATVPANTEVVLHDLTDPRHSVIAIVNGHVSGRKTGDGILSGPDEDLGITGLTGNPELKNSHKTYRGYSTVSMGGKQLNSASTIYYDEDGIPVIAWCINVDLQPYLRIQRELEWLSGGVHPAESLEKNMPEQSIERFLSRIQQHEKESSKQYRLRVVAELHAQGVFKIKGSVNQVAKLLGVTRYTIYNYLEQLNADGE